MTSASSALSRQLATVHRYLEAYEGGNLESMRQCFTDDLLWHIPGQTRVSGAWRGWSGLREHATLLRTLTNGTWHSENLDILVGEHTIFLYRRNTGEREGKQLDIRASYRLEFDGDRIAAVYASYEDQSQLTEFWA